MPITRTCGPRICHVADVRAEDIPLIEHPGFAEHHYSSLVRREGMFPAHCQLFWSPEAMKRYSIWSVDFAKEDCLKGLQNCGLLWVHDKSDHFFPLFTPKPMAQGGSSPGNVVWTHGNSYSTYDHFRRLLQFMDEAGLAYDPPLPKPLNSAQLPDLSGLYEVVGVATPTPGRITGLPNNDLVKAQAANAVPDKTLNSMNSSNLGMSVEKATPELIESVSQKRQVVFAKEGSEDLAYLDFIGAEANVGGADYSHILLRENPGKAAVLEEFLHGTQSKLGIIDELGTSGLGSAETHVKDFMIRHQKMLGLGDEDIKILQQLRDAGL